MLSLARALEIESFSPSACYLRGELAQRRTKRLPRFYDEHVAAQFDDPANRARLTDPAARIGFLVMRHAGLRISSACSLKLDCLAVDPGGQPWLMYLDHKGDDEDLVPISIEVAATTRLAFSHGVMVEEKKLREWRPKYLIARVDRTDPSKNIVRGFLSYEKLLCHHPELKGQVQFWAFLQPSRQDVAAYRTYLREIRQVALRINKSYGGQGWLPIRLEFGENVRKAMAALRNFDVLLVNPVYDGLNLVVKEEALVNRSDGMIVLSENAGAHEELQPHVLSINPFDIEATSEALYEGLMMGAVERKRRHEAAREVVRTNDIARWITRQVQDIRDLVTVPGFREETG